MSDTGLLFVFAEVGPDVSDADFNDWYDNEHAPSRLSVPGITNAIRYKATDGLTPSWVAMYDAASPANLQSDAYKNLASQASDHERALIPRLSLLNRRIYELLSVHENPGAGSIPKYILVVPMAIPAEVEDEFNKWYDEDHTPAVSKFLGWQRCRRYKLVSSIELARGTGASKHVHNYLSIHDFDNDTYMDLPEFIASAQTPWSKKIIAQMTNYELRRFGLHKNIERK